MAAGSDALLRLRAEGIRSLLVEGGGGVITSFLGGELADRLIVGIAPSVIGSGLDAIGDLSVIRVRDGLRLANREVHLAGDDVLIAGDLRRDVAVRTAPATGDAD